MVSDFYALNVFKKKSTPSMLYDIFNLIKFESIFKFFDSNNNVKTFACLNP